MTKSKAQKARAKQQKQKQQKQPRQPKKGGRRRNRGRRGASDSDHSQVMGGNRGQARTYSPRTGVIEKRELIQLVSGSVAFNALKFAINPGLAATFPVGAPEAKNWTEWRCTKMMVEYIPTVSEFATQGQTGEVAIALDYNAENELPSNMQQIEAMHFAGGGIPSRGFSFEASTRFLNKSDPKYVRSGPAPVGEDLRLYDGGNLYFATNGCTNGTQIGKLEVTYRFEVQLPTLLNQGAVQASPSTAAFQSAAAEAGGATGVYVNLLLASVVSNGAGVVNTLGSFVPTAGNYKIDVWGSVNAAGSATSFEMDVLKNGATVFAGATLHPTSAPSAVAGGRASVSASVLVSANGTDAFTFAMRQTGATAGTQWGGVVFTAC